MDAFADGAAIGVSLKAINALATGLAGMRTANVDWSAVG